MPTYEYECPKCGHFEVFHKISEEPLKAKPDCTDPDCPRSAQRLVSGGNFVLKGGGWYKTDYASSGSKGAKSSKSASGSDSKSDSTSNADSSGDQSSADKSGTDKAGTKATDSD